MACRVRYALRILPRGLSNYFTATTVKATIWATAEPGTGIIAGSIAVLRPLIRNITTSVRTHAVTYGHSRKGSKTSSNEEDTIALTSQGTTKAITYRFERQDPWSPTVSFGKANVQRVVSIQGGTPKMSRVQ